MFRFHRAATAALFVALILAGVVVASAGSGPPDFCQRHPGHWKCTTTSATTGETTVTVEKRPCSEPTSPVGRWYSCASAFNTPIPANPALSPDSVAQVARLATENPFGPTSNSVPSIFHATNATPLVTVRVNYPTCDARRELVPIPAGALPGAGSYGPDAEPTMVVANADTGEEIDLFKLTPPGVTPRVSGPVCAATNDWAATVVARNTPGWNGLGVGYTYRGSGTLAGTGAIRPRDTASPAGATWDHAVALAYPHTRNTFVAPATSTDGQFTDAASIPMGSRIQLDPAFNVEGSGLPEWQKQLCRTLQVYGAIIVDTGQAMLNEGLASVRPYVWPWEPGWAVLPTSVVSRMRVLR